MLYSLYIFSGRTLTSGGTGSNGGSLEETAKEVKEIN